MRRDRLNGAQLVSVMINPAQPVVISPLVVRTLPAVGLGCERTRLRTACLMTRAGNQVSVLHPAHTLTQRGPDRMTSISAAQSRYWAWEDLNLRLHPYQLNAGNRCAHRPLPR
jgi:hypothetical protein